MLISRLIGRLRGFKTPLIAGCCLIALLMIFDASIRRKNAAWEHRYDPSSFIVSHEMNGSPTTVGPQVQILEVVRSLHRLHVELVIVNSSGEAVQGRVWGSAEFSGKESRWVQRSEPQTYKARIKTFKAIEFPLPFGEGGRFVGYEIFVSDDATGDVRRITATLPDSSS